VAIVLRKSGKPRLYTLASAETDLQAVTEKVDILGTPVWSPDGKWIVTGGADAAGEGLFKVPADGGLQTRLISGPARDPVWSPDGSLIVYTGENQAAYSPCALQRRAEGRSNCRRFACASRASAIAFRAMARLSLICRGPALHRISGGLIWQQDRSGN
jgi:Tol biopolymer transport system component